MTAPYRKSNTCIRTILSTAPAGSISNRARTDIVIDTSLKSGTTWLQAIVLNLIFQDGQVRAIYEYSPWLDSACRRRRRCSANWKRNPSTLPQVAYPAGRAAVFPAGQIHCGRSGCARRVYVAVESLFQSHAPILWTLNNVPGRVGDPFPSARITFMFCGSGG